MCRHGLCMPAQRQHARPHLDSVTACLLPWTSYQQQQLLSCEAQSGQQRAVVQLADGRCRMLARSGSSNAGLGEPQATTCQKQPNQVCPGTIGHERSPLSAQSSKQPKTTLKNSWGHAAVHKFRHTVFIRPWQPFATSATGPHSQTPFCSASASAGVAAASAGGSVASGIALPAPFTFRNRTLTSQSCLPCIDS